jgi:hypothetical protein
MGQHGGAGSVFREKLQQQRQGYGYVDWQSYASVDTVVWMFGARRKKTSLVSVLFAASIAFCTLVMVANKFGHRPVGPEATQGGGLW